MRTFFRLIIGTILAIVLLPIVIIVLEAGRGLTVHAWLSMKGYYPNGLAPDVAIIAAEKRDLQECNKIKYYDSFLFIAPRMPESSERGSCTRKAIEISKDPKICDTLPPEPRLSCINSLLSH